MESVFLGIFGGMFILLIIAGLIAFGLYIFMSYSLYTMAKIRKLDYAWLAFIPVLQLYTIGKLIRVINIGGYVVPFPAEYILVGFSVVMYLIGNSLGSFGTILSLLVYAIAYYNLYLVYRPSVAIRNTILGIFLPFLVPFFIFSIRNENADLTDRDDVEMKITS